MLRTTAGLIAVVTAAIGLGPRSSHFCVTESRLRVFPCCCISIANDAAPFLACCVPDKHLEPSAVTPLPRERSGAITPALAIPIALGTRDGNAALAAGESPRGTSGGDTGRVLHLRI